MAQSVFICGLCQGPELREFETDQVPSFRQPPEGPGETQCATNRAHQKPQGQNSSGAGEDTSQLEPMPCWLGSNAGSQTPPLPKCSSTHLGEPRLPAFGKTQWAIVSQPPSLLMAGAVAMCLAFNQALYIADPILSSQLYGSHFTEF